jgi:sugar phosphate isomerase/epimerase
MAAQLPSAAVGVAVDVYHVWWDPSVYSEIARASGRILGFHVSDWLAPPPDHLLGRGMMGDGLIELRRLRAAVEEAGYAGPIEVEIFNQRVWDMPPEEALELVKQRFVEWC